MAKITPDSHLDHSLNAEQSAWVAKQIEPLEGFSITTLQLPEALGSVPCGLYGPTMGDAAIEDREVTMEVRGGRPGPSRLLDRPARPTQTVTMIVGPHEGETILYTAFGGPAAPREPWDPGLDAAGKAESEGFWATHALTR